MPSSQTITSFYSFTSNTTIRSSEVNTNFSNFRGHIIPIDPSTSTAGSTGSYDLGSSEYNWRGVYQRSGYFFENTTTSLPATPASNHLATYFKSNRQAFTKNSAGVEIQDFGFSGYTNGDIFYANSSTTISKLAMGSSNQILGVNSAGSALEYKTQSPPTVQKFTSGTGTYTTPAGVKWIRVIMVGGGGGGGGSGTASGSAGGNAGTTTFGSQLSAGGGSGAAALGGSSGGAGGTSSLGTGPYGVGFIGGNGSAGSWNGDELGGNGSATPFGGAGTGGARGAAGLDGKTNTGSGGGGGGGGTGFSGSGGGGAGGYINAIITPPDASYSYAVGAAGAAGTAGTSGYAGGAGAAGFILVEEYYQ